LVPTKEWMRQYRGGGWSQAGIANLSIGQGDLDVTPLQLAVATAAVANGGKVLTPQIVLQTTRQNELIPPSHHVIIKPIVRNTVPVSARALQVVRDAMRADVEDADGTGWRARVPGYPICGKTGTAQVEKNGDFHHYTVWFASYAPAEDPRYAVVVMADFGHAASGGGNCAPVAGEIYKALKYRDERLRTKPESIALR
jgi:penicillin-binding protein 2